MFRQTTIDVFYKLLILNGLKFTLVDENPATKRGEKLAIEEKQAKSRCLNRAVHHLEITDSNNKRGAQFDSVRSNRLFLPWLSAYFFA